MSPHDDSARPKSPIESTARAGLGPGSQVGPYLIEEEIGSGGMGVVFLARRSDQSFKKKVAIKLVKQRWTISDEQIHRFRRERQILANLTHPAIAQLLDGGTTTEGYPYLVMEHVQGQTIDAYCRERSLTLDQILDLFLQVCAGVQFAHQNLIVHRDLKPKNILVDAEGRVKLLDFGIAKILDTESFGITVMETRTGSSPMTLAYASPEQVRGEAITTATDVYALGLLLYELLTGSRPYSFDSRDLPAAVEAICEVEATKPSERAKRLRNETTDEHSSSIASRSIQGDLDAIVLKALAKEPQRRYRSAEQLSEDLIRYRDSLPVSARQGTQSYRARKFFQRNRVPLTATAAVFIVLVAAIFLLLEQQKLLIHQRNRAETVADWMVGLFELSDPAYALGQEVTVRQVLDNSSKTIREELGHDPRLLHQMLSVLGQTYFNIGRSDEARKLTTDALDIAEQSGSIEDKLDNLLLLSRIAYRQGHGQEAYELADQALALARETSPSTDSKLTEALIAKGLGAAGLLRHQETLTLLDEAEHLATEANDLETLAKVLFFSGGALNALENHELGVQKMRRALEIRQDLLPENHPDLLVNRVVLTARLTKKPTDIPRLRQELEKFRRLFSGDSERLVATLFAAAEAIWKAELLDESRRLYEEILEIGATAWGEEHLYTVASIGQIALIALQQGNLVEAKAMYEKALPMNRKKWGPKHEQVATILGQLATIEIYHQRWNSAEEKLLEALGILEDLGDEHRSMTIVLANLGTLELRQDRFETAREYFQRAVTEGRKVEGFKQELVASIYNLAGSERRLGLFEEAIQHYLEVWEIAQDDYSLGPTALCRVASVEIRRKNLDAAARYIDRCEQASTPWLHGKLLRTYPSYLRGLVLLERQQYRESVHVFEENLRLRRELEAKQNLIDESREALERARAGLSKLQDLNGE